MLGHPDENWKALAWLAQMMTLLSPHFFAKQALLLLLSYMRECYNKKGSLSTGKKSGGNWNFSLDTELVLIENKLGLPLRKGAFFEELP
jgi:hypothetical protein